mgnify:CR=1 FL=1
MIFCMKLKEEMGTDNILKREHELHEIIWHRLNSIDNLHVLANNISDRLNIYSFYIEDLHFNLAVQLLNDIYGIQTRGGCSCAGTYGHYLLDVDFDFSYSISTITGQNVDSVQSPGSIYNILSPKQATFEQSWKDIEKLMYWLTVQVLFLELMLKIHLIKIGIK